MPYQELIQLIFLSEVDTLNWNTRMSDVCAYEVLLPLGLAPSPQWGVKGVTEGCLQNDQVLISVHLLIS